jgi:rhamnosyltransferase
MGSPIAAVVPTFRPDPDDVLSLVDLLLAAGVPLVVADDASPGTADPVLRQVAARGVTVVRHSANAGIARSLNAGLRAAQVAGAAWLLTVDQDSVLPEGYVDRLVEAIEDATARLGDRVGAVAAGRVDDDSGAFGYPVDLVSGLPTTPEVIQTGTAWNVEALAEIGGFDETFGIDAVDAAACVRLRASGRVVVLAPTLSIRHRIGHARAVRVLGRTVLATGHSPHRRATMVRNRLRLLPEEFAQSPKHAMRTLRRLVINTALAVTVEEDRWAKAKSSARGILPPRSR